MRMCILVFPPSTHQLLVYGCTACIHTHSCGCAYSCTRTLRTDMAVTDLLRTFTQTRAGAHMYAFALFARTSRLQIYRVCAFIGTRADVQMISFHSQHINFLFTDVPRAFIHARAGVHIHSLVLYAQTWQLQIYRVHSYTHVRVCTYTHSYYTHGLCGYRYTVYIDTHSCGCAH